MDFPSIIRNFKSESDRVGIGKAVWQFLYDAANRLLHIRRFDVIHLTRDHLLPLDPGKYTKHASRLATEDDLLGMKEAGNWQIGDELIRGFRNGDACLLSTVDGKIAGYTWIHTLGRPLLIPGLRISIPSQYAYNFAGFTPPEYRGFGLQPFRHHEVLNRPEWRDKVGMIGYVDVTNFSSKKGQSKSGYQRLGRLTLVGSKRHFVVLVSPELKKMGITRLPATP